MAARGLATSDGRGTYTPGVTPDLLREKTEARFRVLVEGAAATIMPPGRLTWLPPIVIRGALNLRTMPYLCYELEDL
jgi:hypothetical protein